MRKLLGLVAAAAIAFGASAPASAAPVPVTGVLNVIVGTLPPISLPIPAAVVDVTGGTLTVPAGIAGQTGLFVPVTGFPLNLITGIVVTASNGAGSFSGPTAPFTGSGGVSLSGGGIGGAMPVLGVAQVKGALAINVPLSNVGAGGSVNAGGIVVAGAPWTTGVAMVTTTGPVMSMFSATGTVSGPLGAPGSSITLVTPAHINAAGLTRIAAFAQLTLNFVPEPGTLLLLGAGVVGLAAVGRSRK